MSHCKQFMIHHSDVSSDTHAFAYCLPGGIVEFLHLGGNIFY